MINQFLIAVLCVAFLFGMETDMIKFYGVNKTQAQACQAK